MLTGILGMLKWVGYIFQEDVFGCPNDEGVLAMIIFGIKLTILRKTKKGQ